MFLQSRNMLPAKLEEEFSKPVESVMRCEDFKSNFARRLSNRYISRSPVSSAKQDTALKLRPLTIDNVPDNVPERIELDPQLSKSIHMELNGEAVKPPDKQSVQNSDIRKTEVTVLNLEVETLRWQLAQTEANRQMHIALLKQIVSFLNRVKEHIEYQSNDAECKKEGLPTRLLPRSFNVADLPRSRSVVHVNKNAEFLLSTPKKIGARKISKSISNVNGFKDCDIWSQSKISLTPETDSSQKISEEMSRLITLANTVLSTKVPELVCSCPDKNLNTSTPLSDNTSCFDQDSIISRQSPVTAILDQIEEDSVNFTAINIDANSTHSHMDFIDSTQEHVSLKIATPPLNNGLDNFSGMKFLEKKHSASKDPGELNSTKRNERRNDLNCSNFIEDESGFSSMSSFQEIGIPIISIIPPSPCKEISFLEESDDIMEDTDKWKTDTTELEKQTVKVFWV